MVSAPLSARAVQRVGTKAVVVAGMLIVGAGLWLFSTATAASGYGPVATALALFGVGLGLVFAPSTEAIMGSLPLSKTGVGSAMNDTTRLVGGALGVAVFGTVMSSAYASRIAPALSRLPAPAAAAARDSVGAATVVASRLGTEGTTLLAAARSASANAMNTAIMVGFAVALAGALAALLFLPSRPAAAAADSSTAPMPEAADDPAVEFPPHSADSEVCRADALLEGIGEAMTRDDEHGRFVAVHLSGRLEAEVYGVLAGASALDWTCAELAADLGADADLVQVVLRRFAAAGIVDALPVDGEIRYRRRSTGLFLAGEPGHHTVQDPVCGMWIEPSPSIALRTDTGTEYFCSQRCLLRWQHQGAWPAGLIWERKR